MSHQAGQENIYMGSGGDLGVRAPAGLECVLVHGSRAVVLCHEVK